MQTLQANKTDIAARLRAELHKYQEAERAAGRRAIFKQELAERLGISITALTNHLQGISEPSLDSLRKYAAFFKIPLDDFSDKNVLESDLSDDNKRAWELLYDSLEPGVLETAIKLLKMVARLEQDKNKRQG